MIGSAIGAGANVVGGTMQAIAASQAAKAMGRATERELQRQRGYSNEALSTYNQYLPEQGAEAAMASVKKGAETRQALDKFLMSLQMGPNGQGAMQGRDLSQLRLRGNARATLGGYSDWALDRLLKQIRTQNDLNKISNFAAGTAQIFPYRMYDAQHSQDELAFWGQLIQSIGGSAGSFGSAFGGGQAPQASAGPWAGGYDSGNAGPGYAVPAGGVDMFSTNMFGT